jgi:hypothetical protein
MNKHFIITITLCSTMLLACSKGGGETSKINTPSDKSEPLETEFTGTYQALLAPLNKEVSGHLDGSLTIVRESDNFIADIRLSNGPTSSMHIQSIHNGSRCPDERDDTNGDGFIDAKEAAVVLREILIPLDDDLNSQHMGLGTYPETDAYGYYFWSRSASYKKLITDLYEEDINHSDDYVKLQPNKSFGVLNKVVLIRGVPEKSPLPETVAGRGRLSPHMGLPVACGVIRRLTHVPGVVDQDDTGLPVPTGETIGGSSGADDGAFFPTTLGGTTGNYGEDDEEEEVITTSNSVDPTE